MRALTLGICIATLGILAACASAPKNEDTAKKVLSGTDEQIFLGDTIEKNYDPNVIMKRGEAFFEKAEYIEAINEYNHFLELHRTHALASYAAFRIGESQMKRSTGFDRDPDPTQKAIEAFERLRKDFQGSRYDAQALEKIEECHDTLAQMHLAVGQFYYRRGSYLAAGHRFEEILKRYPNKSVAPDALYFLALNFHELGANDWAKEQLTLLIKNYPNNVHTKEGQTLLAKIEAGTARTSHTLVAEPYDWAQEQLLLSKTGAQTLLAKIGVGASPTLPPQKTEPTPASGEPSAIAAHSFRLPSDTELSPSFVRCRVGAWC